MGDGDAGSRDPARRKRAISDGYDALAAEYDEERADDDLAPLEVLVTRLADDARVLDLGCGGGRPVLVELSPDREPVGLDVSEEQLRLARDRTSAPLLRGDMTALPVVDDAVSAVTAFHSIIHVPSEHHGDAFREVARVLRPGGRFLFSTGEEAWTGSNPDWLDAGAEMHWSFPGLETTLSLLADAGFAVEDEWRVRNEMDDDAWPFLLARLDASDRI